MKIFIENEAGHTPSKIYLNQDIKKISQYLNKAGKIIGDDDLMLNELEQAQSILNNLILGVRNPNTELIYFSGSSEEFMKRKNRVKKENVDIICDTDSDEELMRNVMDLAAAISQESQSEIEQETSEIILRRRN